MGESVNRRGFGDASGEEMAAPEKWIADGALGVAPHELLRGFLASVEEEAVDEDFRRRRLARESRLLEEALPVSFMAWFSTEALTWVQR